jgi:predicted nucleic acid-binding protein
VLAVLDSSILVDDWWLQRTATRALLAECRARRLSVSVPEIVIQEVVNKRRERLDTYLRDYEKARKHLASAAGPLSPEPATYSVDDLDADAQRYSEWLRSQLTHFRVRLPALPAVDHSDLLERTLSRRKPFSAKGAGYRDALLWYNVMAVAENVDRVAFLCNNPRDFAGDGGALHPQLAAEAPNVFLEPSLTAFVEQHIEPLRALKRTLADRVTSDAAFIDELEQQIRRTIETSFPDDEHFADVVEGYRVDSASVTAVHRINRITVPDVFDLDETRALVLLEVDADVDLDYSGAERSGTGEWDDMWWSQSQTVFLAFDATAQKDTGQIADLNWASLYA